MVPNIPPGKWLIFDGYPTNDKPELCAYPLGKYLLWRGLNRIIFMLP